MPLKDGKAQKNGKDLPYGYGLAWPTLFGLYIRRLNLRKWTLSFWLSGLLIGFVFSLLRQHSPTDRMDYFMRFVVFFLWGCPGYLFVYLKEALTRTGGIDLGKGAVVFGLFLLLSFWGWAMYSLYFGTVNSFGG